MKPFFCFRFVPFHKLYITIIKFRIWISKFIATIFYKTYNFLEIIKC